MWAVFIITKGVELISRYGHKMTAKDKRRIMGGDDDYEGWVSNDGTRYDQKQKEAFYYRYV